MKKSLICFISAIITALTAVSAGAIGNNDILLSPEINVSASRTGDASVTVSWDKADEAIRYEINLYKEEIIEIPGSGDNSTPVMGDPIYTQVRTAVLNASQPCVYTFNAVGENEIELDRKTNYKAEVLAIKSDGDPKEYWRGEALLKAKGTLTCKITSFLDSSGAVTLTLINKEFAGDAMTKTTVGNQATCQFKDVLTDTYILRAEKKDHVTREYEIVVSDDMDQNVKICPIGDVSGDGKVTTKDFGMTYAHAQKLETLSGYALKCGDVVKNDGKITSTDAARINAHVQKRESLW